MRATQYMIPEQIERNSTRPIYTQIYEQLKRELVLGKYPAGVRFFSLRKLKSIYGMELRTIGAAIDLLIRDGLVEKRATSGIYVTSQKTVSEVGNVWYAVMAEQCYHPFYFHILLGLVNECEKYGLRVVVRIGTGNEEFLKWFCPRPGEGLIITGDLNEKLLKAAGEKCNNNLIVVGDYQLHGDFGNVTPNYYSKVQEAFGKAFEYGCRRIAVITGPVKRFISRRLREAAEECCAEHDAKCRMIEQPDENGYAAMEKLQSFQADCVLMTEPAFAGVWEYMTEHSLRCPENLFLIRYGKEKNDLFYKGRAAIDLESNSVIHGATALQMLLQNSKNTNRVSLELITHF